MHKVSAEKMIRYLETARQRKACAEKERLRRLDFAWEIARQAAHIFINSSIAAKLLHLGRWCIRIIFMLIPMWTLPCGVFKNIRI